jgi:hypothetical protein
MLQNVAKGGCDIAPAFAEQVISTNLPIPLGMGYSYGHVAATILSSLIVFGLIPSIAAAQSHLPQCPSDRNQVWAECTGDYGYPDGSRYVGEFRDNKKMDRAHSRLPTETNTSAHGAMAKKMGRALTHLATVTNTSAIGGIAKETGGALKPTLMEAATLANGGTTKKMDAVLKRTLMEVATLASSGATKEMGRVCSRGPIETNMSAIGKITKKMDMGLMHLQGETNTSAK